MKTIKNFFIKVYKILLRKKTRRVKWGYDFDGNITLERH